MDTSFHGKHKHRHSTWALGVDQLRQSLQVRHNQGTAITHPLFQTGPKETD